MQTVISRKLIGTKEGLIEFLAPFLDRQKEIADPDDTHARHRTRRDRDHARGYVEGMEFVISAIEDWEPAEPDEAMEEND
jgi:hypothetical protein